MKLAILVLLVFAPVLQADTVTTKKGQTYEGVITGFATTVTLETGYGRLRFNRAKQVETMTRTTFAWPGE